MNKLFYCPRCTRVYSLSADRDYLCGRNHKPVFKEGRQWSITITERISTDKNPWAIPEVIEEDDMSYDERHTNVWLRLCEYPTDSSYDDFARHGRRPHLSKKEVLDKYADYVLRLVE